MPHHMVDEAVAAEAIDPATLIAENKTLRDRLLRALAEAENTRRRAEEEMSRARKFAIEAFACKVFRAAPPTAPPTARPSR